MENSSGNDDAQGKELTISQFMWGYQRHFRASAQVGVEHAFKEIGFMGHPQVILVGFRAAGQHAFEICIEPENGSCSPSDLEDVVSRGTTLYEAHPEHGMFHTDLRLHEARHRTLRDEMRAAALVEALSVTTAGHGRTFFASRSTRVDDYEVHTVVSVDSELLKQVPQLQTVSRDRMRVTPSLVHAVVYDILGRAARALYLPDAGVGVGVLGAETPEIIRSATATVVRSALLCAGYWFGSEHDSQLSAISALPYEGRSGAGRIVLAKDNNPAVRVLLKLRTPVYIRDIRAVRKLMEASGPEADLLSDGKDVYGLGVVKSDYDTASETVFMVSVTERGSWELSHDGQPLLSVRDGIARLPSHTLNAPYFEDILDRLIADADKASLVELAEAAGRHEHGAMLIISSDAAGEAKRLAPQAWDVEPAMLHPNIITQLTAMDGGILIDAKGRCHAIGVILDGVAQGRGNPARGSRFNNAIRYLNSDPPAAVVVVYSADGSIDILPLLMPRVARHTVNFAVERYLSAVDLAPMTSESVVGAWQEFKSLRFYLSAEQCRLVNAASAKVHGWFDEHGYIRIVEQDLTPDPQMDDSYWLSDTA